jgi:hypothetical protein
VLVFRAREEADALKFIGSMVPEQATKDRDAAVEAYKKVKFPFIKQEGDDVEKNAMDIMDRAYEGGGFAIDPKKVDFRLAREQNRGKNKW